MKNLLFVILVGFSLTASAEPETLKLSSFATLTEKERGDIQRASRNSKEGTKIEHPAFSLTVPKGWTLSPSGPSSIFSADELVTLMNGDAIVHVIISKSQMIGFDEWHKRFEGSNVSTVKFNGKEFKTFVARSSTEVPAFYFYKAAGHELIVQTSHPLTHPDAKKAELKSMLSTLVVK
jgi:hypothetical protein